jgi:hypothetical protein
MLPVTTDGRLVADGNAAPFDGEAVDAARIERLRLGDRYFYSERQADPLVQQLRALDELQVPL